MQSLNKISFSLGDLSKLLPEFDGEQNTQAPNFLQFLENGIDIDSVTFSNLRILLSRSFKGSARLWWEAYSNHFQTYSEFKTDFLNHFWDKKKQIKIKERLENTEYVCGLFTDHFNYWVGNAKYLEPKYNQNELIDLIAPHFPPNVASSLLGCRTFSEAVARLHQADLYYKNKSSTQQNFQRRSTHFNNIRGENPHLQTNRDNNPHQNKHNEKGQSITKNISMFECDIDDSGNGCVPH